MTTRCMNCIALNRLVGYINLCEDKFMPVWNNRTQKKAYDCTDCTFICPSCMDKPNVKQVKCVRHWDKALEQALDKAVAKYESTFDGDGYYSNSATYVPFRVEPEYPDMLLTREPLFDWKTLGVDITVEHDRIKSVHNSIPKGATLVYKEDTLFFLTRRWAAWHLFKEVFVHIRRLFEVLITGRCRS